MSRPVAWMVIERGWPVYASDGKQVGRVDEVVGETAEDIFSGIAVATGFFSTRYVPSEHVHQILEGRVELDLTEDAVEELSEHRPTAPS
jgi:hypothetical protein